mgnify:CR=1 FL=1
MAVYTRIKRKDLEDFVAKFDIGDIVSCDAIADGIENTNYLLETTTGKYVLTLFEKRVQPDDLPFFVALMSFLERRSFPCPRPVPDRNGDVLHKLSERPAALVRFVPGAWPRDVIPDHCREAGKTLARLHLSAAEFGMTRNNDLALPDWRRLANSLGDRADSLQTGFAMWITEELVSLDAKWPQNLPTGIVHGDLFPDNVFFENGRISGVIDFYFACNDALAFDLAICLNAWCFPEPDRFDIDHGAALLAGYQAVRPLSLEERNALPILARGAAMRFLVTRVHDWFHTPEDALGTRKDPLDMVPVIEFHRAVSDSAAYGLG